MTSPAVLSVRLEAKTKKQLEKLADGMRRSKSFLATEAIKAYIAMNEWQIQEIHNALKEADKGDFASDAEVKQVFKRWGAR